MKPEQESRQRPLAAISRAASAVGTVSLTALGVIGIPGLALVFAGETLAHGFEEMARSAKGGKPKRIPGALGSARFFAGKAIAGAGHALALPAYATEAVADFLSKQDDPRAIADKAAKAESDAVQSACRAPLAAIASGDWDSFIALAKRMAPSAPAKHMDFILGEAFSRALAHDDPKGIAALLNVAPDYFGDASAQHQATRSNAYASCSQFNAHACSDFLLEHYRQSHAALAQKPNPPDANMLQAKLAGRRPTPIPADSKPSSRSPQS